MSDVLVRALDGAMATVPETALDSLAADLAGDLLRPADPDFALSTLIWNATIEKRPALVVRPASTSDVVRAVEFAREHELELSIKGGGHNIAGLALSDNGITLDMSRFNTVEVDTAESTARVGPGCTLGAVDRATQEHGLAAVLGFISETGVAGLTLGGGFGYLTRQFGWTVDTLIEVEIVTADGQVRRASREENPDLFWALRGGGGNFGVVTEFVFGLHQIGPEVTAGLIAWSAEEAAEVLDLYRTVTASAPREMTVVVLMRNAPPAPWLPPEKHGQPMIAMVVVHTGTNEQAASDLAPIRSHGQPWADLIQLKPYVAQQSMLDATQPKGMYYYWKSEFLADLSDQLLETVRSQFVGMSAPANQLAIFHLEGALGEHDEDDGAVGNRDAAYVCAIAAASAGPEAVAANREWVREAWNAIRPFSTGGNYVNFQTEDEETARIGESYRGNIERLAKVKASYDPTNLFRVNRNIAPISGEG
ncbi:MAG TPA: FAD-binding oxidoreductase [Acidimicrobiia bacterium]|nr:FAD-binding oxidoreductase [Acidimicrobiia bacterium]